MNYTDPAFAGKDIKKPSKFVLGAFDILESFVRAIAVVFIILTFFFKVCNVKGASMNNTLFENEKLIVQSIAYTPRQNDIIVFHQTGDVLNEPVVKRVIATGNKWVKIDYDSKTLYVSNDSIFDTEDIVDESDYVYFTIGEYKISGSYEVYVPDGYLFVMGDNRNNSTDSRSSVIGLVDERRVLGKVILRFDPIEKFGTVN